MSNENRNPAAQTRVRQGDILLTACMPQTPNSIYPQKYGILIAALRICVWRGGNHYHVSFLFLLAAPF